MALLATNNTKERDTIPQNRHTMNTKNRPDLTEAETAFLRALLLDPINDVGQTGKSTAVKAMNDDVLFSLPFYQEEELPMREKTGRRNTRLLQLWHAFEDGVKPRALVRQASMHRAKSAGKAKYVEKQKSMKQEDDDESYCSIRSDEEVRVERNDQDDISSGSSWNEEEGGQKHYDSWEVLKDEYAEDFGFDYKERATPDLDDVGEPDQGHVFKILGTSADDDAAHPHVLSPPLMDALMSFVPESLENQNFWLKYSLVRDGSSMSTMKRYVRASTNTILAIETTTGEVFGAFTTSPWRTQFGFFGEGKGAFLWRMRYNRNSPCHSLFEQAQLETEIDVYEYSGLNKLVQHCSNKKIAIGGGNIVESLAADKNASEALSSDDDDVPSPPIDLNQEVDVPTPPTELEQLEDVVGFGIAIDDFLAQGTTSPCATFRNPSLLNKSAETESFEITNIEVWTLTPAWSIDSAEKLEMTKYFVDQSSHSESVHSVYSDIAYNSPQNSMTASDLVQAKFYRRVGENDEGEEQRERWQYANMMGLV